MAADGRLTQPQWGYLRHQLIVSLTGHGIAAGIKDYRVANYADRLAIV